MQCELPPSTPGGPGKTVCNVRCEVVILKKKEKKAKMDSDLAEIKQRAYPYRNASWKMTAKMSANQFDS
jgi:hypothetical protein